MAAQYLTQTAPAPAITTEPVPPATTVTETTPVAATTEAPVELTNDMTSATASLVETNTEPVVEPPPPPRIVQHEGLVRATFSIQAPTKYELISPETHQTINYLYTTSPNLDLSRYKGLHIIVTGEEGLDERWRNTPVITIQQIKVLE
jgi:hypothetical protein